MFFNSRWDLHYSILSRKNERAIIGGTSVHFICNIYTVLKGIFRFYFDLSPIFFIFLSFPANPFLHFLSFSFRSIPFTSFPSLLFSSLSPSLLLSSLLSDNSITFGLPIRILLFGYTGWFFRRLLALHSSPLSLCDGNG